MSRTITVPVRSGAPPSLVEWLQEQVRGHAQALARERERLQVARDELRMIASETACPRARVRADDALARIEAIR